MIGQVFKKLRKEKKMSLSELAEKSGVQIATLSRIEHGKMSGTIESHLQISKALEIDISELYSHLEQEKKYKQIDSVMLVSSGTSENETLTNNTGSKKILPSLIRIDPGKQTNTEQSKKGTEKFIFLIEGELEVNVGNEVYKLPTSGSLYFDGSKEHSFLNKSNAPAKLICVSTAG